MKLARLVYIGLVLSLFSCFGYRDKYPEVPLLPQLDNAHIQVDSLANTRIHTFVFSADKTKIYAIVLTASTGVFAEHTLVEFDQMGHELRRLSFGERTIQQTELALIQPDLLMWQFSNLFFRIDVKTFSIIDEVHTYWEGNYPSSQKDSDWTNVAQESKVWASRKQQEIAQQVDSLKNAKTYQEAMLKAKEDRINFESERYKAYYEAYALGQIRSGKASFAYRSPDGNALYIFTKLGDGKTVAFTVDEALRQKTNVNLHTVDVNANSTVGRPKDSSSLSTGRFALSEGESVTDKKAAIRMTDGIIAQHNDFLLGGSSMDKFLFYYELKLGAETAHFKWIYPLSLSNDFYLQSANGSVYVLKEGTLFWFQI
ncbi:hypothetical protein GCM10028805_31060 [Spirosoma harenae]